MSIELKIKPRNNVLIIEKIEDEKQSTGGIALIRQDKSKARTGRVISVGPGVYDEEGVFIECGVEPGDVVAYDRQYEKTWNIEGDKFTMLLANGIFGKV